MFVFTVMPQFLQLKFLSPISPKSGHVLNVAFEQFRLEGLLFECNSVLQFLQTSQCVNLLIFGFKKKEIKFLTKTADFSIAIPAK